MDLKDIFQNLNTILEWQQLRSEAGIKLEQSREYKIEGKAINVFWNTDNIFFCYLPNHTEKITKKFLRDDLLKIDDIKHAKYLILMIQNEKDPQIIWVELINKTNPKITTLHIDNKWTFNIDENKTIYKNRTLIEQFQELQKDLKWWERELKVRFLKRFFEKQKLTESFYAIYKTELFDKIKKNLITHFGKENEDVINNFILINLNRLLFIHFLDKKGGVFKPYEDKRWSYISYLFHKVYKELDTQEPFYQAVLKPLFFEAFNKPYTERKFNHKIINEEFKNLPYLNWWLFKPTKYEGEKHFIDNAFIKSFIINIVDQFNFTITEDTPFEVKICVDPELLWYIFENLIQDYDNDKTKDDERSKWWIFYTPKIEVDFMCRQVLIEYLSKKEELKHLKAQFYELFYPEKWWRDDQKFGSFTAREIWLIFHHLEKIKVVDPACGSWAFLVGMMQVILDIENMLIDNNIETIKKSTDEKLKEYLRTKLNVFQRKKQLIKSTLHGVDIKSWAVEIAKLRLWLSMIVDIDQQVFQNESVKTQPLLPSFGFKVVQGDSLVNRIGTNLVPINVASANMLSEKMKENIQALATLKSEYYDNKNKNENIIKTKEKEIYEEILKNKLKRLKQQVTILENKKDKKDTNWLLGQSEFGKIYNTDSFDAKKLDKQIEENKVQIEMLTKQLQDITLHGQIPFARGIDFSEIFTEKWWFDIIVWNPPYVRQEAIEDPTWAIKDKKVYKDILVEVVKQDWFDDIRKYRKDDFKIWWRSDLYLYFYFRGLKLLNDQWVFTFITSNSWLDVDFGSVLQEFLIKYCPSIKVFDNQVQRSFASASVNTIMCFFDKPIIQGKDTMTGKAQFVNFNKPYEESIWTETMAELDHQVINQKFESKEIKTWEVIFAKRTTEELRVIDIDAKNLWLDGSETVWEEWLEARKYEGNKRGGKFLRAPDVFHKMLSTNKVRKLSEFYDISPWCYTGINDFFYINNETVSKYGIEKDYLIPVIRNAKEINTLRVSEWLQYYVLWVDSIPKTQLKEWVLKYIERWETQVTRERQKTSAWIPRNSVSSVKSRKYRYSIPKQNLDGTYLFMQYVGSDRFYCPFSDIKITSDRSFHRLFVKENVDNKIMSAVLNSSLQSFFVMLFGRWNLWEWALKFETTDAKKIFVAYLEWINSEKQERIISILNNLWNRKVFSIFKEIWIDKTKDIRSQTPNPLPDRKELDDIIFDELGLTLEERNEIYRSLAELVKARLDKAKSV